MNDSKFGKIYLIPNIISKGTEHQSIPPLILSVIQDIDYFLVEDIRTARRYLSNLFKLLPESRRKKIEALQFEVLSKKTNDEEIHELINPILSGKDAGVISESGCPGIADPGSLLVSHAHRHNIRVQPISGPSSIFLALMGSGMNGQSFIFHGYLPIDNVKLKQKIRSLENDSAREHRSQIFIETPYRNNKLFQTILKVCNPHTRLCIAMDVTGPFELIRTQTISEWKNDPWRPSKIPVVFLIET